LDSCSNPHTREDVFALGDLAQRFVELLQRAALFDPYLEVGEIVGQLLKARQEFMHGRVDQPDDDRQPAHDAEQTGEVVPLQG